MLTPGSCLPVSQDEGSSQCVTPGPRRGPDVLACNKPRFAPRLLSASAGRTCTCDGHNQAATAAHAEPVDADNDVTVADLGRRCRGKGHEVAIWLREVGRIGHYRPSCHYESLIWRCSAYSAG